MQNYFWKKLHKMGKYLIFITLFSIKILSQQNESLNKDFNLALNLFEALQFEKALQSFDKIITDYPYNSKTTVSKLFKAKCLNEIGQYNESENLLLNFLKEYPESKYLDEARMVLSKSFYNNGNYLESFKTLLNIRLSTKENYYLNYSEEMSEKIALNFLSDSDIKKIIDTVSNSQIKPSLLLLRAKLNINEKNYSEAKRILNNLLIDFPLSKEKNKATEVLTYIKENENKPSGNKTIIAVMLPLSGENVTAETETVSLEILEGIKYSVNEFNKTHEEKIGILIENTRGEAEEISKLKLKFQKIPDIKAIIGPVFSNEVRNSLKIFKNLEIPVISPTATDNDLTSLNEFFFQANPPFSIRGKIMAQYLFFVENKRKIAVLNSIDGYSPLIANNFREEFESLSGEVLVQQTYQSQSVSLNEPVKKISEFVNSLEGIYIPLADKSDAPVILSALAQEQINLPIYGNQDWLHVNSLQSYAIVNDNLTISSDYFLEFNDEGFQEFGKNFYAVTGKDVNRNMLYGFDTAKYLLTVLRNTYGSGVAIRQKMESGITSSGYHNNISFGKERVNRYLNIIHYINGKFELIDKFRASN